MTTRITSNGPSTGVVTTATAPRVTPPVGRPFEQVVRAGAGVVVNGAEAAIRRLPGGPILAAAVREPVASSAGGVASSAEGPAGTAGGAPGGLSTSAESPSMDALLARNADQNLLYLELQERISAESRSYTALSNVLKARHDTVKNAIGNIR
jgi:hypothetical protein